MKGAAAMTMSYKPMYNYSDAQDMSCESMSACFNTALTVGTAVAVSISVSVLHSLLLGLGIITLALVLRIRNGN